jgi:hypothetical protein
MGREASVQCQWAEEAGFCKVLLESRELIVRGSLRRRVPISQLSDVSVEDESLRFRAGEDQVSVNLGAELAQKWAKALQTPPPTLAKKMGISRASRLLILGSIESAELKAVVAEGTLAAIAEADLIVASVKTPRDLEFVLDQPPLRGPNCPPVWIVYPKGAVSNLGELSVRELLRQRGFIDTKVASVSAELTALRFIRRDS